jgi:transcriptional regulator with XRE-family HTH domain
METWQRQNKSLRLQRRLRGWSQDDVAAGLHRISAGLGEPELGVDATMVSRWERGTRKPRPRYVRLLCRLFELPPEQLGVIEDLDVGSGPDQPVDRAEDGGTAAVKDLDEELRMAVRAGAAG